MEISGAAVGLLSLVAGASPATKLLVGLAAGSVMFGSFVATSMIDKALDPIDENVGTVIHVIDGDTLIARVGETETTIRLLNVDTPETKDPDQPVECLGAEATSFLEDRLPNGTAIALEYDQERTDRYGRTLAGVFESGTLVNEEIAAAGMGTAVVFEPNHKFYETVLAAQLEAEDRKVGLFDAAAECTLPGLVREASTSMSKAGKTKPSTSADAQAAETAVSTARSEAKQLYRMIKKGSLPSGSAALTSYSSTFRSSQAKKLKQAIKKAKKRQNKLTTSAADLKAAEEKRADQKRRAAEERRLEKERRVAEKRAREAEQEREAEERRKAERQREAEAQRTEQEAAQEDYEEESNTERQRSDGNDRDDDDDASGGGGSDTEYPGYTGPRCYEPGGKSWNPC